MHRKSKNINLGNTSVLLLEKNVQQLFRFEYSWDSDAVYAYERKCRGRPSTVRYTPYVTNDLLDVLQELAASARGRTQFYIEDTCCQPGE